MPDKEMNDFATVILTIPNEEGFTYRVPEEFRNDLRAGMQVVVPFGKRYVSGIVLAMPDDLPLNLGEDELKSIYDVVGATPVLSGELMDLLKWISDYYVCHLGEAYRLIQSGLNVGKSALILRRTQQPVTQSLNSTQREILENIPCEKTISLANLQKKFSLSTLPEMLRKLERSGYIERNYTTMDAKKAIKSETFCRLIPPARRTAEAQQKYAGLMQGRITRSRELIHFLEENEWCASAELVRAGFSRQVQENLTKRGLIEKETRPLHRNFDLPYFEEMPEISLTDEQREFVRTVEGSQKKKEFGIFLLHGITGSGKTQAYIELIRSTIEKGRQAIVLIPEIVLTPQTLARFRHHFPGQVAVLHSRLSAGEKREILHKIREGEFNIVIGPRSAIFAPLQNLGLVVVDEEHESSYKQSESQPRYHARDVAIYRAKLNNAVVILGSATPSFESLHNAQAGHYKYFELMKRVEKRALPRISVVNLREEWSKKAEPPVISESLELKIESRLLIREQVMVLQNRRGYSPYLLCKDCGYVAKCPQCEITLTYHQGRKQLLCHYCGHSQAAPDCCPECQGIDIQYKGIGTQRLEEMLTEKFPHARILRMDYDTTRRKNGHLQILEKFRSGAADLLLGTQMIAKGLDFKRVSLVGIVASDQGLHFPDFRASEKVFQLLTQAAGRAGRGAGSGEVVVQTYDPSHYMFKHLLTHNYSAFYSKEMESRRALNYPPFSRLMLLRVIGKELRDVEHYSDIIAKFLWKANEDRHFAILGPAPAPISRLKGDYRYHILIKQGKEQDSSLAKVRRLVKKGLLQNPELKKWPVKLLIDVDPVDIL